MAISVVLAVGEVAEPLIAAIREASRVSKSVRASKPANEMGPLITREHRDRVAVAPRRAAAEGATVAVDGRRDTATRATDSSWASLLDHVRPGMCCYDDEIFGPVLSVVRVDTYAEALRMINDNPYGNGTAIFTRMAARRGNSNSMWKSAWWASMCRFPFPSPTTVSAAGSRRSSAICTCTGRKACSSTRGRKWSPAAGPIPAASKVDLGFPQSR